MSDSIPIVYVPQRNHPNPFYRHKGDTFRELLTVWEREGYIRIVETSDASDGMIWMYNKNDVMLYERPTLDWLPNQIQYNIGLFGNPNSDDVDNGYLNSNWIFWSRSPIALHDKVIGGGVKPYSERSIKSIFIGNIENEVQSKYRLPYSSVEWKKNMEVFEMTNGSAYKYTQAQYLDKLGDSLFGLSLRGYGGKCNREIELLGLGVVPLLVEGVDVSYYDPLVEGLHFFRIQKPSDIIVVNNGCTKNRWEYMSDAGQRWYNRNCSPRGSFITTQRIINKHRNSDITVKRELKYVSTMATNNSWDDLQLMLYSLYQYHPHVEVYIVCDQYVKEQLPQFVGKYLPQLGMSKYTVVQTLDEYTGMDRKTMEQHNKWLEFMLRKCDGIDAAFESGCLEGVLFVDCDMVFLNEMMIDDFGIGDIGRSQHFLKDENERQYGKYNGGFLWIDNPGFTDWWKFGSYTSSRYYEQAILEDASKHYSCSDIPIEYNYGWWRLYECDPSQIPVRESKFRVQQGIVMYDGAPLRTIHTHFGERSFAFTVRFNQFMMKLLVACKDDRQSQTD